MSMDAHEQTFFELMAVLKAARTEGTDIPLSTIAVLVAEAVGRDDAEIIIRHMKDYIK